MFNIEEIQGVKINGEFFEELTYKDIIIDPINLEGIIDALNDKTKTTDKDIEFGYFDNGYAISSDGKYICHRNGDIFKVKAVSPSNMNGTIIGKFYCDRAIANIYNNDHCRSGKGFVNQWGEILTAIPYDGCKNYGDGIAPVKINGSEVWDYIDAYGGTISEQGYKEASCFYGGTAVVLTRSNEWQLIERGVRGIHVLCSLDNKKAQELMNYYDKMANRAIADDLKFEQNHNSKYMKYSIIDKKTKMSTFIDGFIDEMAKKFGIVIYGTTTTEKLISLIHTLSSQGIFVLSRKTLDIYKAEQVKGTKITNESGQSIISFDESLDSLVMRLERKKIRS